MRREFAYTVRPRKMNTDYDAVNFEGECIVYPVFVTVIGLVYLV